MGELFQCEPFAGFGPNSLAQLDGAALLCWVAGPRPAALRSQVRSLCSRRPGVYGMLTAGQELVYVGKSKCLRSRLLSYFRRQSRDPKAGHILRHAAAIVWE